MDQLFFVKLCLIMTLQTVVILNDEIIKLISKCCEHHILSVPHVCPLRRYDIHCPPHQGKSSEYRALAASV